MEPAERIDRRAFVAATGALVLGGVAVDPALARRRTRRPALPLARGGAFPHGVASGDLTHGAVTLWTRPDDLDGDRRLTLEVARDPGFRRVVARKPVAARAARDFTAEKRVTGLRPAEEYYYRFATRDLSSPVGRFRTLPPRDSRAPVRIGIFSCQEWQAGYYGAHAAIAADDDLDLVICLGDYVYEFGYNGPRKDTSGANKDGDVQTLADYRSKYRLYRSDEDLQAMHAAHPVLAIYDDHEVSNDWAGSHEGDTGRPARGPFVERRRAALRAFYEYLPMAPIGRPVARGHDLYRRQRVGANAELFLLDERLFRDPQPCNNAPIVPCPEAETAPRSMLGPAQLQWLQRGLEDSTATWKLVAGQVMMMALELGKGNPVYKDGWDGYGAERRMLLGHIAQRGVRDVAFLTGDFHTWFAGDLGTDGRGQGAVAPELVFGSVTSLSDTDAIANLLGVPLPKEGAALPYELAVALNPHIKYAELISRGFGVVEVRQDELLVQFRAVDALRRTSASREIGRFRVARGDPRLQVL